MLDLSIGEIKTRVSERRYTDYEWNRYQLRRYVIYKNPQKIYFKK